MLFFDYTFVFCLETKPQLRFFQEILLPPLEVSWNLNFIDVIFFDLLNCY